jgi:hypothetical protein
MTNSSNFDKIQLFQNVPFNTFYYINGNGNYTQFPTSSGGFSIYPEGTLYYMANLTQAGLNPPTASGVWTNLPDDEISFTYSNVGIFSVQSLNGIFTKGKTHCTIQSTGANMMGADYGLDTFGIRLRSNAANSFSGANSVMVDIPFQIIVLP